MRGEIFLPTLLYYFSRGDFCVSVDPRVCPQLPVSTCLTLLFSGSGGPLKAAL